MNVRRCLRPAGALFVAAALLPACAAPPWQYYAEMPPAATRPCDPWVVRCVLDRQPRMLVIALDKDLWAAYDTQTCTLFKTWRGDVNFDGPVYTSVHGPQPASRGDLLPDPLAGSEWHCPPVGADIDRNYWREDHAAAPVRFLGYRVVDGHAQLAYELTAGDGSKLVVHETIEVGHSALQEGVDLFRTFEFDRPLSDGSPWLVLRRAPPEEPTLDPAVQQGFNLWTHEDAPEGAMHWAVRLDAPTMLVLVHHDIDLTQPPGTQSPATIPARVNAEAAR